MRARNMRCGYRYCCRIYHLVIPLWRFQQCERVIKVGHETRRLLNVTEDLVMPQEETKASEAVQQVPVPGDGGLLSTTRANIDASSLPHRRSASTEERPAATKGRKPLFGR